MKTHKPSLMRYLVLILLMVWVGLCISPWVDQGATVLFRGKIESMNAAYLEASGKRCGEMLVLLTGLKEALGFASGSSCELSVFGTGFSMQVGRVFLPVYDAIGYAWKGALASAGVLAFLELLQHVAAWLGRLLFPVWSVLLLFYYIGSTWLKRWGGLVRAARSALSIASIVLLFFYIMLPFSMVGAASLADRLTREMHEDVHGQLQSIHGEVHSFYGAVQEHLKSSSTSNQIVRVQRGSSPVLANADSSKVQLLPQGVSQNAKKVEVKEGFWRRLFRRERQVVESTLHEVEHPLHGLEKVLGELEKPFQAIAADVRKMAHVADEEIKKAEHAVEKPLHALNRLHHLWGELEDVLHRHKHNLTSLTHRVLLIFALEVFVFPLGMLLVGYRFSKWIGMQFLSSTEDYGEPLMHHELMKITKR